MNDDELVCRLRAQGRTPAGVSVQPEQVWRAVHRRRQRRVAGAAGAGALALVAAIGVGSGLGGAAPVPLTVGSAVEFRGVSVPLQPGGLTARDVAAAQTAFGVDLLHAVCAEKPGENLLLSPTSAAEALGLVQPAARGETAAALADLLHLPAWSPELVAALHEHTAALGRLAAEGGDADADRVRLSNRVWLQEGAQPSQEFLDGISTAYDAGLVAVDFMDDPGGATGRINEAVAEDTAGIIDPLFDEALREDTRAVLTNAVHLKATWATEFDDAEPGPFAAPGGEVTADLMPGGSGVYRTAGGWEAVELPYRDGTLAAVAVLPPEGTDPCAIGAGELSALAEGEGEAADVTMPRLRLEQKHELTDPLEGLGMPRGGDYSGFGVTEPLAIDRVVQKTYLDLDEDGTEAAAATAVVAVRFSAPIAPDRDVVLDRPFLLLLTDVETRSPLFLGVVQDPTAG